MARLLALLLLASLGACARRDGGAALEARLRRAPTTAITDLTAEGWRKRLAEFSRGAGGGGALDPKVFSVPLQGDSCGRGSLSVLMVQVPAQCEAPPACPRPPGVAAPDGAQSPSSPQSSQPPPYRPPHLPQPPGVVAPDGTPPPPPYGPPHLPRPPGVVPPDGAQLPSSPPSSQPPSPPPSQPSSQPPSPPPSPSLPYGPPHTRQPPGVVAPDGTSPPLDYFPPKYPYPPVNPTWPPGVEPPPPSPFVPPYSQPNPTWPPGVEPPPPPPFVPPYGQPNPTLPPHSNYSAPPSFPPVEDPGVLVQKFLDQLGEQPQLPPVVIDPVGPVGTDDNTVEEWSPNGVVWRRRQYKKRCMPLNTTETTPPPPQPRFPRSLYIRANLTVPRADYTEPYEVRWDAETGAARIDYHGGTASSYRQIVDGVVYRHMLVLDRTGESNVRRCTDHQSRASKADRELPALPNLEVFSFAGRDVHGNEVWRHTASGHSGELGAARGEQLTFRHELLLKRSADQYTTIPLRYSVRVDSSLLGPDCDGYIHQFDKVEIEHHHPSILHLSHEACDYREWTEKMETVEPLREFTSLHRAQHHDVDFKRYMETYTRLYADDRELATRKNIFIQNSRFVASANRQGASFELELNFLSDRLTEERRVLLGVEPNFSTDSPCKPFPHSPSEINANRGRLSRTFDWRELGAVTHVRFQGTTCMSCWAHATVGALEGALFRVTNRLVPLSEQVLVDCAKPYGGNGCSGTWPTAAYEYMKAEGIPALTDYKYEGKEQLCRANSVRPVQRTHISTHVNVTINNIVALKMAISKYGPTVVIIDGETLSFTSYKRGYYYDGRCRKGKFNHAVLAVGWTVHREETYFILKNSWSENWGEAGYVLMRAPTNTCGVLQQPTVPVLPQETELLG